MGKKSDNKDRMVYTTHPGEGNAFFDDLKDETPSKASNQSLYVSLDRKQRRGKEVTLVEGFQGNPQSRKDLAQDLKSACGAGGAVKEGVILVQGNHVDKIVTLLKGKGYHNVKIKGGY